MASKFRLQLVFAYLAAFLAVTASTHAFATSVAISKKSQQAPAVDLVYQGKPLDPDAAIGLAQHGVDLSTLDPLESDAWKNTSLAPVDTTIPYPADGATVRFDSLLPSVGNLFRGRVLMGDAGATRPYQLMMSLEQHGVLAMAALLRRLGYPIASPRWYSSLTIQFADVASKNLFLDNLSDSTLTARTRWIKTNDASSPEVTLQDLVLEPADIEVPDYQWGIVPAAQIEGRRVERALIVPFTLLDVPQSVNLYGWELGRIYDDSVVLTQAYAQNFRETTFDDARWIARRLGALTRADLTEVVAEGHFPPDVAALATEKLVARRNQMLQLFDLPGAALPYNVKITTGAVKAGKLTQQTYDGYAERFSIGDPASPLRVSEIFRYLVIEGLGAAIEGITTEIDNYLLTASSPTSVTNAHQASIAQQIQQAAASHSNTPFSVPVAAWGGPTGGIGVSASRSVISGTYYGSDAKVQLVDSLQLSANIGYFMGFDGVPKILPSVSGNLSVQRNYLHIRPVEDMETALKTSWPSIFVPSQVTKLAKLLQAKKGTTDDYNAEYKAFADALGVGDMLVITDTLVLGVGANVTVPIPVLLNPALATFNPSVSASATVQPQVFRRTTITRTSTGIQVYLQTTKLLEADLELDFNWVINIVKLAHVNKVGTDDTDAYLLDQQVTTDDARRKFVVSMRAILKGSSEVLAEDFQDYHLKHDAKTKISRAGLLWWRWNQIDQEHSVKISPPGDPPGDQKDVRTLYEVQKIRTSGTDIAGFLSNALSNVTGGVGNLNMTESGDDPGSAFLGRGNWSSYATQAETTPGATSDPQTTIQHNISGWIMSHAELMKALDQIEASTKPLALDKPLIRRDVFATTKDLELYDIMSTLVIYKEGIQQIEADVFDNASVVDVESKLARIETPATLGKFCGGAIRKLVDVVFRVNAYSEKENGKRHTFVCVSPWMKKLLEARHDYRKGKAPDAVGRTRLVNNTLAMLENKMELVKLMGWLTKRNFFFQIDVSGFRFGDEAADETQAKNQSTDYLSDSIGSVNTRDGTGAFSDFAAKYGISTNELYARYMTDGY
jgi:hypothetical protein